MFLKFCAESAHLISMKEDNGVSTIVSVQRSHDMFQRVKTSDPDALRASVAAAMSAATDSPHPPISEAATAGVRVGSGSGAAAGDVGGVSVFQLLKLPKALRDIFGAVRGEFGECLKQSEVRASTLPEPDYV